MKKPAHRFQLEDALYSLRAVEHTLAELQSSNVFQTFTTGQQIAHRDVLSRLRDLILEIVYEPQP